MFKNSFLFLIFLLSVKFCLAQTSKRGLQYYLQTATTNSPLLKDYQNQIQSGQIDSSLIRTANRPLVKANGQAAFYPTINGYGYDKVITNGANYSGVLSISQPLFNKGILKPQYRKVEIKNLQIHNRKKISKLSLHKKITHQYLVAYAVLQQLQTNKKIVQLLLRQKGVLKKMVKEGFYSESDYLTVLSTLQTQEIKESHLKLNYNQNLSLLNYLSGINDTSKITLANPSLQISSRIAQDNSVFLKQYRIDSLRIQNKQSLLDAKYKPQINWFANAGLMASTLHNLHHYFGAGFGINLSIPIYDGKQRKLKYQQYKIAEQTRKNYASFYQKQYSQKVALLMQQLHGTSKLIDKIQNKLKTAQILIQADKKLLNSGNLQITKYILAVQNYLTIKSNLNQTKMSRYQIINQLNYWNH